MTRFALLLTGICLLGCQSSRSGGKHDSDAFSGEFRLEEVPPPCDPNDWPGVKGPQINTAQSHSWYLDQAAMYFGDPSGLLGKRKEWPYPNHTLEMSWARVQVLYWLAASNLPDEVDHWLGIELASTGWSPSPYTAPVASQPPTEKTARELLDEALQAILLNVPLREKIDLQLAEKGTNVVEIFGHRLSNVYPDHTCEAAWMHCWNAWLWAKSGIVSDEAVHWIICEIEHDM